jgi:hypothetical protein
LREEGGREGWREGGRILESKGGREGGRGEEQTNALELRRDWMRSILLVSSVQEGREGWLVIP